MATYNNRTGAWVVILPGAMQQEEFYLRYAIHGYEIVEQHPDFAGNRAIFMYQKKEEIK